MTFMTALSKAIDENIGNNFADNYDYHRFGKENERGKEEASDRFSFRKIVRKMLLRRDSKGSILRNNRAIIKACDYLYRVLANEADRQLLVKILAYRILGYRKVKLPTNNDRFWKSIVTLEKIADKEDFIDVGFMGWKLFLFDLEQIGFPLRIYSSPSGIYINFIANQYEYKSSDVMVKVDRDDIVIDAGGGWGDTALRFAFQSGENGKVYSFEAVPGNVELIHTMIKLNPEMKERIEIVQKALWDKSGLSLLSSDNGPASNITFFDGKEQSGIAVRTISLDDFVAEENLAKVDFIKMDIEGAELNALKGAEKTIRKYRPKLAISIYHKPEDFRDIPQFIKSLDIPYNLYIGHYTIHREETILYAIAKR